MAFKCEQYKVIKVTLEFSPEEFEMVKTAMKYLCNNNHENITENEMWNYDTLLDMMTS